jgi:hypothetical protein
VKAFADVGDGRPLLDALHARGHARLRYDFGHHESRHLTEKCDFKLMHFYSSEKICESPTAEEEDGKSFVQKLY